jgi:pyruvate,water dikinase
MTPTTRTPAIGESGGTRWEAPDKGLWSLEAAHGDSFTTVPMRALMEHSFAEGFRRSFAQLGVPLSHVELRHVHGWPYVSFFMHDVPRRPGKPPPAFVLKAVTRLHPGFRRRTKIAAAAIAEGRALQMTDGWERERAGYVARNIELQRVDVAALGDAEFAQHVRTVAAYASAAMLRHFELVAGCIPVGTWLARCDAWGLPREAARTAVMHSTPVHVEAGRRLARIAAALDDASCPDLDAVRAHSPEAAAALDDYLDHHGWWSTEDALDSARVIDHPALVLQAIAATRNSAARDPERDAHAVLDDLRTRVPAADRDEFDRIAAEAHRAYCMLDDNSGILASWVAGIVGETLRESARRLAGSRRLSTPDDIWALTVEQIVALLEGTSPLDADAIAALVAAWRAERELDPPPHLNGTPGPPPDPGVFPAPVAALMTAIGAFLDDKFNDAHTATGIGNRTATGRAVVATSPSDAFERLQPGDILVTTATTPAYDAILTIVGGLVVSQGGPSSHAAIMARELDVPAIVGLHDAITTITDGTMITIDPVTVRVATV